jgi:hypothetical protein
MRLVCKISGEEFFSSEDFKQHNALVSFHPIFYLTKRQLLATSKRYGQGGYSAKEEKLLFLAMLNSIEAVEWLVPADPDMQTIGKYTEQVYKLLAWYEAVSAHGLKLPKLRVTEYNYNLHNIGGFIQAWYEVRQEWMAPKLKAALADLMEAREYRLHKLIHSAKSTDAYAKRLATWAMDAANVPEDRREEWVEILSTPATEKAFSLDLLELQDLKDHMERELYAVGNINKGSGSIYSAKVLEHLQKLLSLREGGMLSLLGGTTGNKTAVFTLKTETQTFTEEDAAVLRTKIASYGSTEVEPKKEDYPGKLVDYLRAKAAWTLAKSAREDLAVVTTHMQTQAQGF